MGMSWKIVIDAGAISVALLLATFLRAKLRFLQRFMVPNALTAGFILLPFYNWAMPALGYGTHRLGELVYHLLNVSFIAMTLRAPHPKSKDERGGPLMISVAILWQYAIQALVGLLAGFALLRLFWPGLSPAFGLFLPLGFALGPGQAFAIGRGWEPLGFEGAATVGLAFAAVGYLWSSFVGVPLITWGIKRGRVGKAALEAFKDRTLMTGIVEKGRQGGEAGRLTTDSEAIDSLSFHAGLVVFTYLLSYLLLSGLTKLLAFAGPTGVELATNLWGINFIFSSVTAMLVRVCLKALGIQRLADDATLTRLSGFAVDYMVAGSIAAIAVTFVARYWAPLLVVTTLGGVVVTVTTIWMASRLFRDHPYERMLMVYGLLDRHALDGPGPAPRPRPRVPHARGLGLHEERGHQLPGGHPLHPLHQPAGQDRADGRLVLLLDHDRRVGGLPRRHERRLPGHGPRPRTRKTGPTLARCRGRISTKPREKREKKGNREGRATRSPLPSRKRPSRERRPSRIHPAARFTFQPHPRGASAPRARPALPRGVASGVAMVATHVP